ncbi:flagellar basal body-associated FliL family protein [Schlegelella sp. S2-27]|uniref:Flagellar protein FliL n=1 Tax=Caldimonas mangrovi TaxID=2944811 RepID=A0ABT0YKW8_9BURK|nr:flagellar basal body-associated FliL family protein [Caldimonas mangrovi]MCM5679372.1 flagellar basal body-associated FliL family protein [Caldimonas mangrovi]
MPAPAAAAAVDVVPKSGGKKKLLLIIVTVLVLLAVAAAAALVLLKKRQAAVLDEELDEDVVTVDEAVSEMHTGVPPVFLALDPFTFNLADKNVERYAQIGITLELESAETAEKFKAYMPAVRGNILMLLAHKSAEDLLDRVGKERLAAEIMREAVRPMGINLPPVDAEGAEGAASAPAGKKRKSKVHSPVTRVHFSNFIIQ